MEIYLFDWLLLSKSDVNKETLLTLAQQENDYSKHMGVIKTGNFGT